MPRERENYRKVRKNRMNHYLFEFRFQGKAKDQFKKLIYFIDKKFQIGLAKQYRQVPHVSLVGPFSTNNEQKLIRDLAELCESTPVMNFLVNGYDYFSQNRVVFICINPDQILDEFRWNLSKQLQSYCKLQPYDYERNFIFHSTIARNLDPIRFEAIKKFIDSFDESSFKYVLTRVTLIKNQIILREYDFMLRRLLNRSQAKNGKMYAKMVQLTQSYLDGKYDPNKRIKKRRNIVDKSLWSKIKGLFSQKKIFITSDLHLGHANIIRYCNRPFRNVDHMNKVLISNWNNSIRKNDTVYFLGDLAYGRGSRSTDYWLTQLNGNIIFIKGSHDRSNKIKFHETYTIEYKGISFFLSHEPEKVPKGWKGWAICGHHHNNRLQEYPFIDRTNRRINISTELTNYKPVDMNEIIARIKNEKY